MKKLAVLLTILTLFAVACKTSPEPEVTPETVEILPEQPIEEAYAVSWTHDANLSCITLTLTDTAAEALAYPNGPTDHLCVSSETEQTIAPNYELEDSGTATVVLENLEMNGTIYQVDVVRLVK